MRRRAGWVGLAATLPVAACSLLTDLDGYSEPGAPDSAADARDAADASVEADASRDGGSFCRPGFTGESCTTACPKNTAGATCEFRLVLGLNIPVIGNWDTAANVPYSENGTASAGAFSRVAYRFVLDADEVWVELDAFTNDATRLGIPADWIFDQAVTNVVVHSFAARQPNILVPSAGNVEMWSNCYAEGTDGLYDSDDVLDPEVDCFGSFQIHVAKQPVISFNDWSGADNFDLGIGRAPATEKNPDWTFSANSRQFSKRRLEVYVH